MHTLFKEVGQHTLNVLFKHLVDDGYISVVTRVFIFDDTVYN